MAFSGTPVKTAPGLLYVAPLGTTEPTTASAALPSAWRPVGYTDDGVTISTGITVEDIEVAEEAEPIRRETVKRDTKVSASLAEVSRQNLALSLNAGAAAATTGSLEPPDLGSEVRVMMILDTGAIPANANAAPGTTNARWLFRQGIQADTIEMGRKKAPAKALIPISFSLEKPSGTVKSWIVFPDANGNV